MRKTPDAEECVSCTESSCSCESFRPGGVQLRSCEGCGHGWVAHALRRLGAPPPSSCSPVEVALPGLVLDLSSLVLYGAQAVPVRLKILLDRLYSILTPDQVGHILQALGWTLGDYVRGYMVQYPGGKVLDRWSMVTLQEEPLVLQQFLRFGETRPIVELMAVSDPELRPAPRSPVTMETLNGRGDPGAGPRLGDFPGGLPLLLPVHFSSSAPLSLTPPTEAEPGGTRRIQNHVRVDLKIKTDPDWPHAPPSPWSLSPPVDRDRDRDRAQLTSSPPSPPALLHPPSSTPSSLHPLPSFSSSFLCPLLPSSSTSSSSLQPLPSSLCSAPPPSGVGGRKGRVCCGVCGKSFYDKGTLKIHYNAVHLKIKHRCTVPGCAMVFSSLRSRNRHSANPNPRLHLGTNPTPRLHLGTNPTPRLHLGTNPTPRLHLGTNPTPRLHLGTNPTPRLHLGTNPTPRLHLGTNPTPRLHLGTNPTPRLHLGTNPNPRLHLGASRAALHDRRADTHLQGAHGDLQGMDLDLERTATRGPAPPPPQTLNVPPSSPLLAPPLVSEAYKPEHHRHANHVTHVALGHPTVTTATRDHVTRGHACSGDPPTNQRWRWAACDGTAKKKKKPRKSSTPVKIEREPAQLEGSG